MEEKKIIMIYKGRRNWYDRTGTLRTSYTYIANDKQSEESYKTKLKGSVNVGARIECFRTDDGVRGPYVLLGLHQNNDEVNEWINADMMAGVESRSFQDIKKIPKKYYDQYVAELKRMRQKLPMTQRHLFDIKLIQDISK